MPSTRDVLADPLVDIAARAPHVVVDTDTGSIRRAADLDHVNVGIAEAAAVGTAAGLAASGERVLLCAFSAFAAGRAYEFIKLDIAYPGRPVCIATTHGGVSGGWLGPTHHALEDTAAMYLLPNVTVLVPADLRQAIALLEQALTHPGPTYLRLGRKACDPVPSDAPVRLGEPVVLRRGAGVAVVATGPEMVRLALAVADAEAGNPDADAVGPVHVVAVHTLDDRYADELSRAIPATVSTVVTLDESWSGAPLELMAHAALRHRPGTRVLGLGLRGFQEPGTYEDIVARQLDVAGIRRRLHEFHPHGTTDTGE